MNRKSLLMAMLGLAVLMTPLRAQDADVALAACNSAGWQVRVFQTEAGFYGALAPEGAVGPLQRQSAFGDHALVGVWTEANLVLNLVLRADGSALIRVQPMGSERTEEAADCGDDSALRFALESAG